MAKTLQLNFTTAGGKKMSLTVDEPLEDLTAQTVEEAMQEIINSGAFEIDEFPLESVIGARIIERNITELLEG